MAGKALERVGTAWGCAPGILLNSGGSTKKYGICLNNGSIISVAY